MHIEIGIIEPARAALADAAALGLVATQLPAVVRQPSNLPKVALSAVIFSVLMQAWHMPVGPSELHLVGATTVYILFGFAPAMLGFALGLLLQVLLFEPEDMAHLGVNALSLMLPMAAVHYSFGRRLFDARFQDRFSLARVLRIDAIYYAGVSAMVGFWLLISTDSVALADWGAWVAAYLPVFMAEALLTFVTVTILAGVRRSPAILRMTEIGRLKFA